MILSKFTEHAFKLLFVLLLCLSLTVGHAQDQDEPTPVTITEVASTQRRAIRARGRHGLQPQ